MDAIKKKMQAMKLEKDNAMDRADACEQQAKDANLRAERVKLYISKTKYATTATFQTGTVDFYTVSGNLMTVSSLELFHVVSVIVTNVQVMVTNV